MIELDTLNRLLAIEYNYEQLLRLHEQLIHEHEGLKEEYAKLEKDLLWWQDKSQREAFDGISGGYKDGKPCW